MSRTIKYPSIPRSESNKDFWFYFFGYVVFLVAFVVVVSAIVLLVISMIEMRSNALESCIGNGYPYGYCKMMLN